jgi:hypothetical protein
LFFIPAKSGDFAQRVIKKIQDIQKLPAEDQEHLFYVLDSILQNVKAKQAFL